MAEGFKQIKDPIYGYIKIPTEYMNTIIDTRGFQRLRRISQTSYSPLYPSAMHNRFVHSIGVFYLGSMVAERLIEESKQYHIQNSNIKTSVPQMAKVYKLACLLHDVGHAPFSHTGEEFYKNKNDESKDLHNTLIEILENNPSIEKDIPKEERDAAAPHEIMSAIIGLKYYAGDLSIEEKEFFARCITGYKYSDLSSDENQLRNCFIGLLNSKVIDVDRMDYLIRDSYITGFQNIDLDYRRLISSITIAREDDKYILAYNKSAISILENAVYAHDAQKKWIQTHPSVLYETFLIKVAIEELTKRYGKKLFSLESLTEEGITLEGMSINISYLCDDDVIFLMKNLLKGSGYSEEYFDRSRRRHPIWKSEADFRAFIVNGNSNILSVLSEFGKLHNTQKGEYLEISSNVMEVLNNEKKKADESLTNQDDYSKRVKRKIINGIDREIDLVNYLLDQVKHPGARFVLIYTNLFYSDFAKEDLGLVKINMGNGVLKELRSVCNINSSNNTNLGKFPYLFYQRSGKSIDVEEFCESIVEILK